MMLGRCPQTICPPLGVVGAWFPLSAWPQRGLGVAFLGAHLAAQRGCGQSGIPAVRAQRWGSWARTVDDGWDIRQAVGERRFRALAPTQGKGIATAHAAVACAPALTKGQ